MSLYDDLDGDAGGIVGAGIAGVGVGGGAGGTAATGATIGAIGSAGAAAEVAGAGWAPGIRLLQTHLKAKRALGGNQKRRPPQPPPHLKPRRSPPPKSVHHLPPHVPHLPAPKKSDEWDAVDEYDPMWPNDYEKTVKELREQRDRDGDPHDDKDKDRKGHRKRKSRFGDDEDPAEKSMHAHQEEDAERSPPARSGGAAIAPPPSLREPDPPPPQSPPRAPAFERPDRPDRPAPLPPGNSVAAKIMAKYGFKEGQGLGKKEQGMSMALQVEKTSKRGGRIIHEKDAPPPVEFPRSASPGPDGNGQTKSEPSITEILKSPSKVVLLRNMVGSGDVDEELEPEVKDECHTKYGDVIKVVIFEIPEASPDEAVRIFVEFKRIESAIKAVVDLNGRFFGGRQVKAGFYSVDHFANLQLLH